MEKIRYRLSPEALSLEKGQGANPQEVKAQADLISAQWDKSKPRNDKPFILLLGGFQGSGKTTILDILTPKFGLIVISLDKIRNNLFEQGYQVSDDFRRLVNATKFELVRRALDLGQTFAVDQSLTPDRVKLIQEAIAPFSNFALKSVFLFSPIEVLRKRVEQRPRVEGYYRGTLAELEKSIKEYAEVYGEPSKDDYDLYIDTNQKPEVIADTISGFLT